MAEQEEIDAALDAALDELDDDDDDDDEEDKEKSVEAVRGAAMTFDTDAVASNIESTQNKNDKPAAAATTTAAAETNPKPVVMGPPRPPVPPPAAPSAPLPPFQIPDSSSSMDGDEEQFFAEMMAQVQSQFGSNGDCTSNANEPPEAFLERLMQEMQSQLQSEVKQQQQQPQPPASSSSARCTNSKANIKDKNGDKIKKTTKKANEVDQAISNLIQDMAKKSNQDDDGDDNSSVDRDEMNGDPEAAMLQQLIKGLGELGSGGLGSDSGGGGINADAMIDGMMEQLMSKDLMYEPMKQVADKFPQWLQERRTVLSLDEYAKREKQCECFQQLVHVYETEPNNNGKLVLLMQQVQEYGQPPSEIIQEIAPGLDLDPDGVPKFQFPGMGGAGDGGLFSPGMNEEDCVIM